MLQLQVKLLCGISAFTAVGLFFIESVVLKSLGKRREYIFSVSGWTSPCVPTLIHLGEGTVQATSADSAYQKGDIFYRNCSGKARPELSVFLLAVLLLLMLHSLELSC